MKDEQIKDELEEETDTEFEDDVDFETEDLTEASNDNEEDEDVEFSYDDDGNIVIPDDSDEEDSEDEKDADEDGNDSDDASDSEKEHSVKKAEDEEKTSADKNVPDTRDAEIENLRKQLAARDAQIKDTLKSLGADENGGIEELERIAAEATDTPLEEYRQKKAERLQQEEAIRIVKKQQFEEMIRADLASVHQAYPETKQYKTVFEFPNFAEFSKYRDLGLSPEKAYIAANPQSVMTSVATATQQQTRNLANTKTHLHSNVPVGSKDKSITITKKQMSEYKDLFPNMSDKEIIALHKQTMKK